MEAQDIRRMVSMVRAIRAGKWTATLPAWTPKDITETLDFALDAYDFELRAVQTAEAFILLAHSSRFPFDETKFLQDCGFIR